MKIGLALLRDVTCFVNFLERICIYLYGANLDRDNLFGQDVALEVLLQCCVYI